MSTAAAFVLAQALLLGATPVPARTAPAPASSGGGEWVFADTQPLTEVERARIRADLAASAARLERAGKLPHASAAGVLLAWPLKLKDGLTDFGYHGISNFVDQDSRYPGFVLDWNCGTRSYDTAGGYNHAGIDIFLWPFAFNKMDADEVEVVAGVDGVILGKDDGNPDRSCGFGAGNWNAVYVRHSDGSQAWYGHMKTGSPTAKAVGDTVAAGERLGIVGSSGNSTAPHLHLELYDASNQLIEPFSGPCNSLNPDSWWLVQPPYYDPAVNKLTTGTAAPELSSCPDPDISHEALTFRPGDRIFFTRYLRDQLQGDPSVQTIYRPDDSVFATWTHSSSDPYYAASYWWNSFDFPASEPIGTWRFEVVFGGRTYEHEFYLVADSWLLRNAEVTRLDPLTPALATIFTGAGNVTLDLAGPDGVPGPGEGDDDDAYVADFAAGGTDPDPNVVINAQRPLVFYQDSIAVAPLQLTKAGSGVRIDF